ncbi:tRNA (N(6)-L-threonylcarbamoyladenosine(37)-C(2))-methylthiotransferase MtaB [Chitinophagales bacterium]|jgi:threonylcarbamoyladenosine tRNA methylthiotransferase MtaB|nr:tRNA (N(6)-L-threonylcarbamoyladenosine(37)-C(2))-methylthiotransferase MtaB [Chitinophagales bacterium]|tara:strand:- start:16 stop:1347 length:1332 start_codon:yes stop_codon:yes gene_type:complete
MFYNRKVAYYTLGCKLNFSETSAISRSLNDNGYTKVDFSSAANYYVINTCSVTENADKKCKQIVKQAKKTNPEAKVIIIGCYAQLKPDEIAKIKGVDLVLGANEKFRLHEHLEGIKDSDEPMIIAGAIKEVGFYSEAFSYGERTRSFVKIQDGCDYFCSFCTIPLARGRSRSSSIDKTLSLVNKVANTKVKEIVLTGVNIGDFGKTEDGKKRSSENFHQLIQALDEIEAIDRFRISSIEPNLLKTNIIKFVAQSKRFVPHFHIPLQSGSDKILKLMRRKYDTDLYRRRIATIRAVMPECCIGVDVIVGFPGETDEEFMKTYDFLNDLDVSYLHVFTYSERANTKALQIEDVVPIAKRRERSKMLRILSEKKRRAFYTRFENTSAQVLFEAENDEGTMYGFTQNYVKVGVPYQEELVNTLQQVQLGALSKSGIIIGSVLMKVPN